MSPGASRIQYVTSDGPRPLSAAPRAVLPSDVRSAVYRPIYHDPGRSLIISTTVSPASHQALPCLHLRRIGRTLMSINRSAASTDVDLGEMQITRALHVCASAARWHPIRNEETHYVVEPLASQ